MKRAARFGLATIALLALASVAAPLPARLTESPSPVVAWRDGQTAWVALAPDDRWRVATTPDRVDPDLVTALLALEDSRFYLHPGVDPLAIFRAALTNLSRGRVVSGASTLTMQVVRMVEPRPRTVLSKIIEAWRAFGVERRLGKDGVLSAWLTFAPYGRNVEGVEAASWMLFGHGAEALSADEISLLLTIPQDPTDRLPSVAHSEALRRARDEVARRLDEAGALPDGASEALIAASTVPDHLTPFPRQIPHTAARLTEPGQRVVSSLDAATQRTTERILNRHRAARQAEDIHNAAVLLVDLQDMAVRAAVGGFDYGDAQHAGNIDALSVPRSPGSALKPLIYALAIDAGLALPEQLVPDVPRRYGTWIVDNYDGTYNGVVRLESALSRSLNVPFVDLLAHLGVDTMTSALGSCGATSLDRTPGHYGLSAAVGGIEVAPAELAPLYAALMSDGACRRLRWTEGAPASTGLSITSPGAAWLTRRALRLRDRPDLPTRRDLGAVSTQIAWKTGTSQGHHDAWALGSDGTTLVVVWLGNLDQRPSHHLVGAETAGALMFDLLEAVAHPVDDPMPADLRPVELCALSGHVPGEACPHRTRVMAPVTIPAARCPYHATVEIDDASGLAVLPGCRAGSTHTAPFVVWPGSVRQFLHERGEDLPERPALAPGCVAPVGDGPRILSPVPGQVTVLLPGRAAAEQEVPLVSDADGRVSWFVDGAWVGQADRSAPQWWAPTLGAHEIVVVDEQGRAAHGRVEVVHPLR